MAKLNQQFFARVRDLLAADACFSGTPGELAAECGMTPMEIGKAIRNPVMMNAFEAAGYNLLLVEADGGCMISLEPK